MKISKCVQCQYKKLVNNVCWCNAYNKKIDLKEIIICYKFKERI